MLNAVPVLKSLKQPGICVVAMGLVRPKIMFMGMRKSFRNFSNLEQSLTYELYMLVDGLPPCLGIRKDPSIQSLR